MLIYRLLEGQTLTNGEVVELVYGTSLENWRAFIAYRGFESHPLRQTIKVRYIRLCLTFIYQNGDVPKW